MESSNITLPDFAISRHCGVDFGVHEGRHFVRCECKWVSVSEADFKMVLNRVQAEPTCELSAMRSGAWIKFWLWNGKMSWIEVPLVSYLEPASWSLTDEVTFPEFSPERHVAQDPMPEVGHPFAFVDSGRSKGYFLRAHGDGTEVWIRVAEDHWDQALRLYQSNEEDDPKGEFYESLTVVGVVANDEYRLVVLEVDPMSERGEVEVRICRYLDAEGDQAAA